MGSRWGTAPPGRAEPSPYSRPHVVDHGFFDELERVVPNRGYQTSGL
jgi:hypothetical protein